MDDNSTRAICRFRRNSYRNFVDACKPMTRVLYISRRFIISWITLEYPEENYDKLVEKDPKLIQMDIIDFIKSLGKRGLSYATISTYAGAIRKFYDMNDIITLNWKKIRNYIGDHEKVAEDRPYTHGEIQTLLSNTNLRNRGIILIMCSAGLRLGAIPQLRMRDLEPVDSYGIYKITPYAKSKKWSYTTWCTPGCRKTIEEYIATRRRWGERITDESPVFRIDYNIYKTTDAKPITIHGIRDFMGSLLLRTGLRKPPTEGQIKRLEVMMNHGMRKFFETNAFRAGMNEEYIRRLMGHKGGSNKLSDTYNKIEEEELLEGDNKHVGYIGIIDALTISEEHRLKDKVEKLQIKADKVDAALERIMKMEQQLGLD